MEIVRCVAGAIRGESNPTQIGDNLLELERQLLSMGARYDPDLDEAIAMVRSAFSSVHFVQDPQAAMIGLEMI